MLGAIVVALTAGGEVTVRVDKVTELAALGWRHRGTGSDGGMPIAVALHAGARMVGSLAGLARRHHGIGAQHALSGMIGIGGLNPGNGTLGLLSSQDNGQADEDGGNGDETRHPVVLVLVFRLKLKLKGM